MRTTLSGGIGSGMNLDSIMTQLQSAEKMPLDSLDAKASSYTAQLSGIGKITSALAALRDAADSLSSQLGASSAAASNSTVDTTSTDTEVKASIDDFIKSYNALNSAVKTLTAPDSKGLAGGPLQDDNATRAVQARLRSLLTQSFGDQGSTRLAQIGILTQADGNLKRDSAKFDAALSVDREKIVGLFTGGGEPSRSLDAKLSTLIDDLTGSNGLMTIRKATLSSTLGEVEDQKASLQTHFDALNKQLRAQYASLDNTLGQLSGRSTDSSTTNAFASTADFNVPDAIAHDVWNAA
ncbi:hypothetical protein BH10PSE17_BH10PSE17_31770 [soil metagenome]